MKEFLDLTLEGLPFFTKKTTFNLNQKGISLILGRNLDSSNHNTNAAGKSMFFSQLPEMLIGEPTIGGKSDLIRKGSTSFRVKSGGHIYTVTRLFKPSEKLIIEKDGVDLEYRELSAAKAALKKLLPFNEQEVLSLLYLDSRIPHPIVRGNSSIRKNFFMEFFRMNSAPTMRKIVKAEIDALSSKSGAYEVKKSRLTEIKAKLKDQDLEILEARQEKLKRKIQTVEVRAKRYAQVERINEDYQEHRQAYRSLDGFAISWEDAQEKSEVLEEKLNSVTTKLGEWKIYEEFLEGQRDLVERQKELEKEWEGIPSRYKGMSLDVVSEELEKAEKGLEELLDLVASTKGKIRDIQPVEQLTRQIESVREKIKELKSATDTCPTCGGEYSNKHAKKELAIATDRLDSLRQERDSNSAKLEKLQARLDSYSDPEAYRETIVTVKRAKKLIAEDQRLKESKEVLKPKSSKEFLLNRRATYKEQYQMLLGSKPVFAAAEAYRSLTKEDNAMLKEESPTDLLLKLHEDSGELRMLIEEVGELTQEGVTLSASLREMKSELDEKPALDVLYEALSRKGVESLMIKLVCERLEQQVNKYARLLFPEDVTFSFELETQFNISVTRNYGKGKVTSDVRKLSGAESLLFSLILLIALLAFVPAKNRCNLLVLDEPTANFGPEMIDAFVRFLPILNSVIPHIVIITPLPNNTYAGAKVYTVVKKGGQSRIVEGTDVTTTRKKAK